jgi:peptide/nickel transport system permease protein
MPGKVFKTAAYYGSIWIGIVVLTFVLFHTIGANPARKILGPNADSQQVIQLEKKLGLDKPKTLQLLGYFERIFKMDLGRSYLDDRLVSDAVYNSLIVTTSLVFLSLCLILVYLCVVLSLHRIPPILGFLGWVEVSIRAVPVFFSGVVMVLICGLYFPVVSFTGDLSRLNNWIYLLPPAFVLSFYPATVLSEVLKKQMSEVMSSPFVAAERSLGCSEGSIIFKYALRNSVVPLLAAFANILPLMFTGAFIVEIIFSISGIGSLLVKSIMAQDLPMIEGIVVLNALIFVITNFAFETAYTFVDPRMRVRK